MRILFFLLLIRQFMPINNKYATTKYEIFMGILKDILWTMLFIVTLFCITGIIKFTKIFIRQITVYDKKHNIKFLEVLSIRLTKKP